MRIDGMVPSGVATVSGGSDITGKLKPGDNVRAQILENSGSELTLKFSDGSVVTATAASNVEASEGEFVSLTFRGTVNDKPAFEMSEKAAQPQVDKALETIKNTLTSLKLPVTEQNIQLARALSEQNVPVTAESMGKMSELINKNPELKPNAAAFLTASKLSNDANNIDKLQSLLAGRLKIGNDISELVKLISTQGNGSETALKPAELENLVEKLVTQLAAKLNDSSDAATGRISSSAGKAVSDNSLVKNTSLVVSNNTSGLAGEADSSEASGVGTNVKTVNNQGFVEIKNIPQASVKLDGSALISHDPAKLKTEVNTESKVILTNAGNQMADALERAKVSTDRPASAPVASVITDVKSAAEHVANILKGEALPGKADIPLLNSISKQLDGMLGAGNLTQEEQAAAKVILREISSTVLKIQPHEAGHNNEAAADPKQNTIDRKFEAAVNSLRNLFVKIDEESDEINPVKLYKEMDSAIQTLKSSLQQLPQGMREAASTIVNNLESNVSFINHLNNYSSYVQLPLSMFNQNTTGELYMLKKGSKARKLDPSNMTVLISLDSDNIGRIDTLLSVDKKNISTNFRLESSDVFPVLKEHHKQLYNSLLEKGFRLVDFTYRLMDEPINIVNFEAEARKEFIKSSNNIDICI